MPARPASPTREVPAVIRLFAALDLPDPVRRQLAAVTGGIPGARWTTPDRMHLTLRFIGEVDNAVFRDVRIALSGIFCDPFPLTLRGLGTFGDKKPRVIFAAVDRSDALMRLQAKVDAVLQRINVEPRDMRKFTPHVTLARLRDVMPERVALHLDNHGGLVTDSFTIDRFTLYSSQLSSEGSRYRPEGVYPLGDTALEEEEADFDDFDRPAEEFDAPWALEPAYP